MTEEEKKIIVDEDWKSQAQKEKEQLSQKEDTAEQDSDSEQQRQFPGADMTGLISMLATQAFLALGLFGTEDEKEPKVDLEMAKYSIDMLGVIEEKTKGNLTEQESQALEATLHQLRMTYVTISKQG